MGDDNVKVYPGVMIPNDDGGLTFHGFCVEVKGDATVDMTAEILKSLNGKVVV